MKKINKPISLELLAEGYCRSIENAQRLIDDGEILFKCSRYLAAINSFRLAIEEMAKAHLINQAIAYDENAKDKWMWFWNAFHSHSEKLKLLEYELHWNSYKDREEFNRRIKLLISSREDSIYVKFDRRIERFLTPEQLFRLGGDLKQTAELDFRYALKLFQLFIPAGMPSVDTMLKVFRLQRDELERERLKGENKG
jgi:AbiV family abortive infection protein